MSKLDAKIPAGDLETKWTKYKSSVPLVNPSNKRNLEIVVVGAGLAGSAAAAALAELGYKVKVFCFQDSPRRAHSIAAQGGINASKNYQNDGLLSNRSFGGTQVQRTFYAAGQTGQQLLLGAYSGLQRQVGLGNVQLFARHEMLEVVNIDGKCRGIIARDLISGKLERHFGHAVLLCTGGYGNVFYLSTNAMACNVTAAWKAHKKGAYFANPCYTQIHPTCIPVSGDHQSKLTLMSESLRNDGRIWVPKHKEDAEAIRNGKLNPNDLKEEDRDYYLERRYPAFGNLVPRDVASRAAKERCDAGFGVNTTGEAVFLDFAFNMKYKYGKQEATKKNISNPTEEQLTALGHEVIKEKYGNLFDMYKQITGVDPYKNPMMIYPAVHYTMGGLWVDYNLMTTVPGLYALGEANFSDHGANRLGASALMQGLADGYFVIPYTIGAFLANEISVKSISTDHEAFVEAEKSVQSTIDKLFAVKGTKSVDYFHKRLGKIIWDNCGMARNVEGLTKAITEIQKIREEFWKDVRVTGEANDFNPELEKAGRVADFIELGELMCKDALERNESCGGHFREDHQTEEGEALRDDENFKNVSAWEFKELGNWELHKEELVYENIKIAQRSYK
jgi:succinate dehydrogenase / fumarate reductase flavoprotein subunit